METNRNKVKAEYKELNLEDKSKKIQNDEYHKYYLSREDSIITDLFKQSSIFLFFTSIYIISSFRIFAISIRLLSALLFLESTMKIFIDFKIIQL